MNNQKALSKELSSLSLKDRKSIIESALESAYQSEVIDTDMKSHVIGEEKDYPDKYSWMIDKLLEWKENH